jgi:broad specificity phosphatase PhoE
VGERQAADIAIVLKGLAADVAALGYVASPMARARRTMEIARVAMGLVAEDYRVDARLKEMSFGIWEGHTLKQVRERWPADFAARENDKWPYVPEAGESYAGLAARAGEAIGSLTRDTVVVSHGGVARVLLAVCADVAPQEALRWPIWQGRVLVLRERAFAWSPLTPESAPPPPG